MAQGRSKVAIVSSPNGVSALVMALEDRRIAAAVMNFLIMICSGSLSRDIGCDAAHTSRQAQ
jgi:hypothetical protein